MAADANARVTHRRRGLWFTLCLAASSIRTYSDRRRLRTEMTKKLGTKRRPWRSLAAHGQVSGRAKHIFQKSSRPLRCTWGSAASRGHLETRSANNCSEPVGGPFKNADRKRLQRNGYPIFLGGRRSLSASAIPFRRTSGGRRYLAGTRVISRATYKTKEMRPVSSSQ
jgi:hypothetical protein